MTRRYLWLGLALVLALSGCTTSLQGVPAINPTAGPDDAVAQITYRDGSTEYISQATLRQFQLLFGGGQEAPAAPVLDELLTRQLLLRQARNKSVAADPAEIEQFITSVRTDQQTCGGQVQQAPPGPGEDTRAYFDACAQAFGFANGLAFRDFLAEQLTINAIVDREAERDQIQASHILWQVKEDPAQNDADYVSALNTYDRICGRLGPATDPNRPCANADQFANIAKEVSQEPGAKQSGGQLPPFNAQGATDDGSAFDTTFVSQTWALRQRFLDQGSAVSYPFLTQFGWHIVKIDEMAVSAASGQAFRQAVLERAKNSSVADLEQADQGPVPLIGVIEILQPLPSEPAVPTPEPILPEETALPEATSVGPEADQTVTPEPAATETAEPAAAETAEPETTATATP